MTVLSLGFWSKVNEVATEDERLAFNEWLDELFTVGDRIRDESLRINASDSFNSDARDLMRAINEVPHLMSR